MEQSFQDFEKSCVQRARVSPQWLPGSNSVFWYRQETRSGEFQFDMVDCEVRRRRPAFDHSKLASELGKRVQKNIDPGKLPFLWINVAADTSWVRFQFNDHTWQYTQDGKLDEWRGDFYQGSVDRGCEEVASPYSRQLSTIKFVNRTPHSLGYFWIDYLGNPEKYGSVQSDQVEIVSSYVGHIWRLAVPDSERRVSCAVKSEASTVVIEEDYSGLTLSWETNSSRQDADASAEKNTSSTGLDPFVRDFNVWVRGLDGTEKQISYQGVADKEFKDLNASPDGRFVVAWQCEAPSKSVLNLLKPSSKDPLRPQWISKDYLRPGDNVEIQRPHLFDVVTGTEIFIDNILFQNPYRCTTIGWSDDPKFRFIYNERGHQRLRLLEIGINGSITVLVEESSKTFIDYAHKLYYKLLTSTNELLWASERDGWNHLYLFSLDDGTLKNQVTRGPWLVHSVESVDEDKRQIWFQGMGMVPGQDPYYFNLACVNFDGSGLCVATEGDGTHTWKWGPEKRFLIDSWSTVNSLPQSVVREAKTGKEVVVLQRNQLDLSLQTKWTPPERFVAPGRDGKTSIYGVIIRPIYFDSSKSYPVLERIYAGPQDFSTPKKFGDCAGLRRQGYIVVCADGMGTNWRSKAFHDVCYKNLKDAGFADRIAWISAAAKSRPWMDLSRVGCYGSSAGGQSAAAAVIHHSNFYKAALAAAGCHDNRMDKLWWNELWMGYPVDASYEDSSNITHAHKLGGALMLVVGELDTNVDPASTLRLAHALIEADKDFDLVFVPGGEHNVIDMPFVKRKQEAFFKKHLQGCCDCVGV